MEIDTEQRVCEFCGRIVCLDCLGYIAVHKRSMYKNYEDLVPVCPSCKPRAMLSRKLLEIVDEVFGEGDKEGIKVNGIESKKSEKDR